MSAATIVLGLAWIGLAAFTVALVLSRASRERVIRREIAAKIRTRARQVGRFQPDGSYTLGLLEAATIAEGVAPSPQFLTLDGSRRPRMAGQGRRSS